MLMIFPMLIVMRLLMKWKNAPETWKLELKCNVIMEAKYKPNHGVCNLIVYVLIDGLVHLLQYPDFCEICCFFGWVFFLNTFPNNVYEQCLFINLSYAQSFLRMITLRNVSGWCIVFHSLS